MARQLIGPRVAAIYEMQSALLDPHLKRLGISWTTFQLLSAVMEEGGHASQIAVARSLGVAPATMSESVQAHIEKGYLNRTASPKDGRVKLLSLTERSISIMDEIRTVLRSTEDRLSQGLSDDECNFVVAELDRVLANLEGSNR